MDAIWRLGFARNIVFCLVNGGSVCGRRRFAAGSCWIFVRSVTEGSSRLFLFFVDAVLFCCAIQSMQIAVAWLCEGFSRGTCFFSTVLRLWLCFARRCWQIALEWLHHGCDLNVRICTKHCVFFRSAQVPLQRKVGSRARRVLPSSLRRRFLFALRARCNCGFKVLSLFFLDAVPLCFASSCLQIAVEWLRQGSSLLRLRAEYYCLLQLRVVNRTAVAAWRLRMVLWQLIFLHFGKPCV